MFENHCTIGTERCPPESVLLKVTANSADSQSGGLDLFSGMNFEHSRPYRPADSDHRGRSADSVHGSQSSRMEMSLPRSSDINGQVSYDLDNETVGGVNLRVVIVRDVVNLNVYEVMNMSMRGMDRM